MDRTEITESFEIMVSQDNELSISAIEGHDNMTFDARIQSATMKGAVNTLRDQYGEGELIFTVMDHRIFVNRKGKLSIENEIEEVKLAVAVIWKEYCSESHDHK